MTRRRHSRRRGHTPGTSWSPPAPGAASSARLPSAPVKGQISACATRGPDLVERRSARSSGYLVPRGEAATCSARRWRSAAGTPGNRRRRLRADPRHRRGRAGRARARARGGARRLRPGTPDNVPLDRPGAPTALVFATGHTATACCSRRSPPTSSPRARRRAPAGRAAACDRSASRRCRVNVHVNGEPSELPDGATVRTRSAALELPGAARRRGRGRRRGRAARRMADARLARRRAGRGRPGDPGRLRRSLTPTRPTRHRRPRVRARG